MVRIAASPASAPPDATPGERPIGSWSRLANVVLEPRRAFAAIAARPTWLAAFVAVVTLRFASLFAFYRPATTPLKLVGGVVFQLATVLPPALLMTLVVRVTALRWRIAVTWSRGWSIVLHVMFAYTLGTVAIASVAGALLPASVNVDLRHPPFTNAGSLVPTGGSGLVSAFVTALDIRMAYAFALLWVAFRSMAAPRHRAARAVGTLVAAYLVAAVLTSGR